MQIDIDRIIKLYKNCSPEVLELILRAFNYLLQNDREYAIRDYENLCSMKINNPYFSIEISSTIDRSHFNSYEDKIILKEGEDNFIIFFHELIHAFHYYKNGLSTPNEFSYLMLQITKNNDFQRKSVFVINYISDKKSELMKKIASGENDDNIICELQCYVAVEDIIDALTNGQSHDNGLCVITDINSIKEKSSLGAGHGIEYYADTNMIFPEIIANYSSIRNSEFKDKLFNSLTYCLGEDFMFFLESYYRQLDNGLIDDYSQLNDDIMNDYGVGVDYIQIDIQSNKKK